MNGVHRSQKNNVNKQVTSSNEVILMFAHWLIKYCKENKPLSSRTVSDPLMPEFVHCSLLSSHVSRSSGLAETILPGTVKGGRRQGGQRKRWEDNIREWTGLEFGKSQRAVENREKWRKIVA